MSAADRIRAALDAVEPNASGNALDATAADVAELLDDRDRLLERIRAVLEVCDQVQNEAAATLNRDDLDDAPPAAAALTRYNLAAAIRGTLRGDQ